jgi:hypothetical protein
LRLAGITRDEFERQKGIFFNLNYDIKAQPLRPKCDKCGSWFHHPWKCEKYKKFSLNVCKVCDKKLHHVEEECMGDFRDKWYPYIYEYEKSGLSHWTLECFKGERCRKDFDSKLSDERCEKCGDRHFPWDC